MLGNDDGAISPLDTNLNQSDNMCALCRQAHIGHSFEIEDSSDARQQRDILVLVECAAPGELGRHEQLKVLCQTVAKTRDLTARTAVIESLHDRARLFGLGWDAHRAARSMTAATSAGWEIYATWLDASSVTVEPPRLYMDRSRSGLIARSLVATIAKLGLVFHAGVVAGAPAALRLKPTWDIAMESACDPGRSAQKSA